MSDLDEMINVGFPHVVWATRKAIGPKLAGEGINVISQGMDFGEIQTDIDLTASAILLNGDKDLALEGVRSIYPGSFSEEDDSQQYLRLDAHTIYQFDPCDGTGDLKKTINTDNPIMPTALLSKLDRDPRSRQFVPVAGMIYDVGHEYGVIVDGHELVMGVANKDGTFMEVVHRRLPDELLMKGWKITPLRIGRRYSYPQEAYDEHFPKWIRENPPNIYVKQVPVGGAGTQALHLMRTVITAPIDGFKELEPTDVMFTCQPDWKTWDTDPSAVLFQTLFGLSRPETHGTGLRDIYGDLHQSNAMSPNLKPDMVHTKGTLFCPDSVIQNTLNKCVAAFERDYTRPDGNRMLLTDVNY